LNRGVTFKILLLEYIFLCMGFILNQSACIIFGLD
jgi:hypothetical protein